MLDFTKEDDQREFVNGPLPAGSIVMLQVKVLQPQLDRQAPDNQNISVAQSGLRQIYCQFEVAHGSFQGMTFRQNITLPKSGQTINLTDNQQKACNIGGATIKAMLVAAKKPLAIKDVTSLNGLKFPARVKLKTEPTVKDGRTYWNNELAAIITPDKEVYAQICGGGEVITDGPTSLENSNAPSGSSQGHGGNQQQAQDEYFGGGYQGEPNDFDSVPF